MSEIDFKASARQGDIVEIGIEVVKFGTASLTLSSEVRNKMTQEILKMMTNLSNVRNIGLIGHIDHGKTTLSDSLLARAGLLNESTISIIINRVS